MGYITAQWSKVKLICANHNDDTHYLTLDEKSQSPCYKCDCKNSVSFYDFEKMLSYIADTVIEADKNDEIAQINGLKWTSRNGISYEILKYAEDEIIIKALNKKLLANK